MKGNLYLIVMLAVLSIGSYPHCANAMKVENQNIENKLVLNNQVSLMKLDSEKVKKVMSTHGLTEVYKTIVNKTFDYAKIIELYPCFSSISQNVFEGYKARHERILFKRMSTVDRRFAVAFNPEVIQFTDDDKAVASAKLVLRNTGRFNYRPKQLINVAKLAKSDISKVQKLDLSAFGKKKSEADSNAAASAVEEEESGPKPAVFSADGTSFRATVGDYNQLFCEVNHDGKWKKIISEVSYLRTPCHELDIKPAILDSDLEETDDEKPGPSSGCSATHWKWHLNLYAWKLALANGFLRETWRADLREREDLESSLSNYQQIVNPALINAVINNPAIINAVNPGTINAVNPATLSQ